MEKENFILISMMSGYLQGFWGYDNFFYLNEKKIDQFIIIVVLLNCIVLFWD